MAELYSNTEVHVVFSLCSSISQAPVVLIAFQNLGARICSKISKCKTWTHTGLSQSQHNATPGYTKPSGRVFLFSSSLFGCDTNIKFFLFVCFFKFSEEKKQADIYKDLKGKHKKVCFFKVCFFFTFNTVATEATTICKRLLV